MTINIVNNDSGVTGGRLWHALALHAVYCVDNGVYSALYYESVYTWLLHPSCFMQIHTHKCPCYCNVQAVLWACICCIHHMRTRKHLPSAPEWNDVS